MAKAKKKKILIVDDSEIDRSIIKNIIERDFEVYEANNGYKALEFINAGKPKLDAMLLDISMPLMDGFQMLRILNENYTGDMNVIMITSEATLSNVIKAKELGVTGFIRKPFDENVVLSKMRDIFGIEHTVEEKDEREEKFNDDFAEATGDLIIRLTSVYKNYLSNIGKDFGHYSRINEIMKIILEAYSHDPKHETIDTAHIEIIAAAAQFFDIGKMSIPDRIIKNAYKNHDFESESDKDIYRNHTIAGSDIIRLNNNPMCSFFISVCSDMCMHHHERYDGTGYPHMLKGSANKDYTQMLIISEKFDKFYSHLSDYDDSRFQVVLDDIRRDKGRVSEDIIDLFDSCRGKINSLYKYNAQIRPMVAGVLP